MRRVSPCHAAVHGAGNTGMVRAGRSLGRDFIRLRVRWVVLHRAYLENQAGTKHVESELVRRMDAGSNPASSTMGATAKMV